jgi:hypothetical protein
MWSASTLPHNSILIGGQVRVNRRIEKVLSDLLVSLHAACLLRVARCALCTTVALCAGVRICSLSLPRLSRTHIDNWAFPSLVRRVNRQECVVYGQGVVQFCRRTRWYVGLSGRRGATGGENRRRLVVRHEDWPIRHVSLQLRRTQGRRGTATTAATSRRRRRRTGADRASSCSGNARSVGRLASGSQDS